MDPIEFAVRCMRNGARIYVRAFMNGKWGSHALADVPEELQATFIAEWWKQGREPVMLVEPAEPAEPESMREVEEDRATHGDLAIKAREFFDDPEVTSPREGTNRENDDQVVAWAFAYGLLP